MSADLLFLLLLLHRLIVGMPTEYPADAYTARAYEVVMRQKFVDVGVTDRIQGATILYQTNQVVPTAISGKHWAALDFGQENGCTFLVFINPGWILNAFYERTMYLPQIVAHEVAHGHQGVQCLGWDRATLERTADLIALEIVADMADDNAWYSEHAKASLYYRLFDLTLSEVVYQYAKSGADIVLVLDALELLEGREQSVYSTWQEWSKYPSLAERENAYFGETVRILLNADSPRLTELKLAGGELYVRNLWRLLHPSHVHSCLIGPVTCE